MNVLHKNFPLPRNNQDFINYISSLENENFSIVSGTGFDEIFLEKLSAFKKFDTILSTQFFPEDQWIILSHLISITFLGAIREKYKHYLESRGEGPVHPFLVEIFGWELELELMGPIPSTSEMKQMLDSCPSHAAPSYYKLSDAYFAQRKEAA